MQPFHVQLLRFIDPTPFHVYFMPPSSRIQPLLLDLKQVADILPELALLIFFARQQQYCISSWVTYPISTQLAYTSQAWPDKIGMTWGLLAPRASILNHHPRKRMAARRGMRPLGLLYPPCAQSTPVVPTSKSTSCSTVITRFVDAISRLSCRYRVRVLCPVLGSGLITIVGMPLWSKLCFKLQMPPKKEDIAMAACGNTNNIACFLLG